MNKEMPQVAILMGSHSDWETMKHSAQTLDNLGISNEYRVISAHRQAGRLDQYLESIKDSSVQVVIAGAGMAAALPGVIAAKIQIPVLGVPMESKVNGLDSLLSMVQMPAGIPVGTFAIGRAGAVNAALFAAAVIALNDENVEKKLTEYRENQSNQKEIPTQS